MNSQEVRKKFLDFFASKAHQIVPSFSLLVKDDPSLLFINSGMAPFKDVFLGNALPSSPRIADTQKCLRVSGKHNDLEDVGVDTYHHTLFEMLGNWSFGDYFKIEAIDWAWELLIKVYGIDPERMYVTVFGGDEKDKLDADTEAENLWLKYLPKERILRFGKKENFWEMGDTGPCGPCSEIHVDMRGDAERQKIDGKTLVNQDHPQVIEIWNLVFMQFQRKADSSLSPLPSKHVDTGMGFERLCMVLQNKTSNYDTDVFTPIIGQIEALSGVKYGATASKQDIAMRVISDHIRAIAFTLSDGQLPSSTGAGYVVRRILRRAVRYGYSFLQLKTPFLYALVTILQKQMGTVFPELIKQGELIKQVIREEEENFLRTLEKGIARFSEYLSKKPHSIDGAFAFELYDTYGFPIDLTQLLAKEENLVVDIAHFEKLLAEQRNRSRKATLVQAQDWVDVHGDLPLDNFIGYDHLQTETKIVRYRQIVQQSETRYQLVLAPTPFYAESGGQAGDIGYLHNANEHIVVLNTQKENQQIVHLVEHLPENIEAVFTAQVNKENRHLSSANHSATHLLHEALRSVLGTHVEQKGSLVQAKSLRFDFSHFTKLKPEELEAVENMVNQHIQKNIPLQEFRDIALQEAKNKGAMALFGEKYGDKVRMIQFGHSMELCGGTHVSSTGAIGLFKIIAESSVAAGVRRIEALSSSGALAYFHAQSEQLKMIAEELKHPKDVHKAFLQVLEEKEQLQSELNTLYQEKIQNLKKSWLHSAENRKGLRLIVQKIELDPLRVKDLLFQIKAEQKENLLVVVGSLYQNVPQISVLISPDLAQSKKWHAADIAKQLAKEIQGGGGGQDFFATAGGKNPAGLDKALAQVSIVLAL